MFRRPRIQTSVFALAIASVTGACDPSVAAPPAASVDAGASATAPRHLVASTKVSADVAAAAVAIRADAAEFTLRASAFGRDGARAPLSAPAIDDEAGRVHLRRADVAIDEWWRPLSEGLEQGFDVARAPAGSGPLVVELAVEGALRASLSRHDVVMRDARGIARASIRQLAAKDARGRSLRAWFTVADATIAIHVDDSNAEYPVQIDPVVGIDTELAPNDPVNGGAFGTAVSLGAKRVLIGAGAAAVGGATPGAAYVFDEDATGTWTQSAKLATTDGASGDGVGTAVLLEGDTAFVGAPSRPSGTLGDVGSVYVFTRDATAGTWSQAQEITPPTAVDSMSFGTALAYANGMLFVAASDETIGANDSAGAVYAYKNVAGTWTYDSKMFAAHPPEGNDRLGISIAASVVGTTVTVAAGAPDYQGGSSGITGQGAVWLFTRATTATGAWTELAPLVAADATNAAYMGWSVAMDGSTLVVGAPSHDTSVFAAGVVYVYTRSAAGAWTQSSEIVASDAAGQDGLGDSVAVRGGLVVAGANSAPDASVAGAGKVYLFTPSASTWSAREIFAPDAADSAAFGSAVDFDGTTLVAGAPQFSSATLDTVGSAYVVSPAAGLALGTTCSLDADCTSGFCTDGVCCESACTGQCEQCGAGGHCQTLDGVPPESSKKSCTFPYKLCVKGACATSCAATSDCATGAICNPSNACISALGNGSACTTAADCSSGFCVDGVCCNTACTDTCEACDASGSLGVCASVTGPTHGTRSCGASTGDPQCGLACDGKVTAQCSYATAATACVKTSCSGSQETNDGVCDGKGSCNVVATDCPGYLVCGAAGACLTGCTSDSDCIARSSCIGGTCTAPKVADCSADHTTSTNQGAVTVCAPYACSDVTGLCNGTCTATSDCAVNAVCDTATARCVAPSAGGGASSGGCAIVDRAHERAGAAWCGLALGLAMIARRRARGC